MCVSFVVDKFVKFVLQYSVPGYTILSDKMPRAPLPILASWGDGGGWYHGRPTKHFKGQNKAEPLATRRPEGFGQGPWLVLLKVLL